MDTAQKTRFEELQAKGWKNLSGDERREFQELKELSIVKTVKQPVITTLGEKAVKTETKDTKDTKDTNTQKKLVYTFTTNIKHGSKVYKEGEEIESPIEEWITLGYVKLNK